jgi:hypothetical protein
MAGDRTHGFSDLRQRDELSHASSRSSSDHGCAAKTWATPPRLKAVVLTGSMVSGMVKSRSQVPPSNALTRVQRTMVKSEPSLG